MRKYTYFLYIFPLRNFCRIICSYFSLYSSIKYSTTLLYVHIRLNFSSTFLLEYSGCAFAAYLQCRGLLCWPLVSYSDSRRDMIPLCRDHNCSRIYHPLIPLLADLNYFSSLLLSPFLTLHLSLSYSTDIK